MSYLINLSHPVGISYYTKLTPNSLGAYLEASYSFRACESRNPNSSHDNSPSFNIYLFDFDLNYVKLMLMILRGIGWANLQRQCPDWQLGPPFCSFFLLDPRRLHDHNLALNYLSLPSHAVSNNGWRFRSLTTRSFASYACLFPVFQLPFCMKVTCLRFCDDLLIIYLILCVALLWHPHDPSTISLV